MREETRFSLSLLGVAAVALAVETLTMRIFSFIFEYHFVSLIISLALLGYGAAGSLYPFLPRWFKEHIPYFLALSLLLFAAGLVFLPLDIYQFWVNRYNWFYFATLSFWLFCLSSLMARISCMLELYPSHFPRFYAANLVGSSLGIGISYLILLFLGELSSSFPCPSFSRECNQSEKSPSFFINDYWNYFLFLLLRFIFLLMLLPGQ